MSTQPICEAGDRNADTVEQPRIPFNKPLMVGEELHHIARVVALGQIAGGGHYTQQCAGLLENHFGIAKVLMTPSCTAALEMAAMLCDLQPGDEVIMPSYTFVSTANAFVRVGAKPVFVDIRADTLNINEALIEEAVTERTRVIVPVHYAGVGCDMDRIMATAAKYDLLVVEDAAQGVNASFGGQALGSIGHLGCYSFHETKNYSCGQGGALCINDERFIERAEVILDKGTNRQSFYRGNVDEYTWVDIGSSYSMGEISAAFLYGQLKMLDEISARRRTIYDRYLEGLNQLDLVGLLRTPRIPAGCASNFHIFFVLLPDLSARNAFLYRFKSDRIDAVFHYVPLHNSPMGKKLGAHANLPVTEDLSQRLVRLPMFFEITDRELDRVIESTYRACEVTS